MSTSSDKWRSKARVIIPLCVLLALVFVIGAGFAVLAGNSDNEEDVAEATDEVEAVAEDANEATDAGESSDELEAKSFDAYTWEELSEIAALLSEASSDEEADELASTYNVSVGSSREITLTDGTTATLLVVGIRHDERSDGTGMAGLTLMLSQIATESMNTSDVCAGGWESSELRAWLVDEGLALLPEDLASLIVPVDKLTNNVGVTNDTASVTVTSDTLWLFSAAEVCGEITWFYDEFGDPGSDTGWVDFSVYDELLSLEGSQYEYFEDMCVTQSSDPNDVLALTSSSTTPWWYRSAYPYSFDGSDSGCFYQVMGSGYPASIGTASSSAGVVVGFCL